MNKIKWFITAATLGMVIGWSVFGIYLFNSPTAGANWSIGELGDFFGGGIGAIAVGLLVFTTWVQQDQFRHYKNETFEAGVFRVFEGLKPEAEGVSSRIISKLVSSGHLILEESFDELNKKFHHVDRTVFLRQMQKEPARTIIAAKQFDNEPELLEACQRFQSILRLIDHSIENCRKAKPKDQDFPQAMQATEIYRTYELCFKNSKVWKS